MRSVKVVLLLISSLTVMAGATVAPALPMIADHFQDIPNAPFWTKLILTLPALFIAVSSPLAGWLLDRFSKVKLILGSMIIYALAGASGLVLDNLFAILVGRAVLGVSVSVLMTGATALVGDYLEGKERVQFLGIQGSFMAFGGTIFVTIAGFLAGINWRYPFGVYLAALIILIISFLVLYEPTNTEDKNAPKPPPASLRQNGFIFLIYATMFIGMAFFYIIPVQSPFLMRSLGAESGLMISLGLIFGTFFAAVGSFFYNRIKVHLTFNQVYLLSFTLMGIGFMLIGLARIPIMVALTTAVATLGAGLLMPNTSLCLLSQSKPHNRGRIMGGMTAAVFTGQFFSPIFFQPVIDWLDLSSAHIVAGGVAFLIALSYGIAVVRFRLKKLRLETAS